jgi:hypothetical protein
LVVLLAVAATAGANPTAHAAKNCSLSSAQQGGSTPSTLGPTYVFPPIKAKHVSCGKAKKVVKAFHTCRHKHGKAGHCASVKGYHCSENRVKGVGQYDSTATCKKGSKKVTHRYTQNT